VNFKNLLVCLINYVIRPFIAFFLMKTPRQVSLDLSHSRATFLSW